MEKKDSLTDNTNLQDIHKGRMSENASSTT